MHTQIANRNGEYHKIVFKKYIFHFNTKKFRIPKSHQDPKHKTHLQNSKNKRTQILIPRINWNPYLQKYQIVVFFYLINVNPKIEN